MKEKTTMIRTTIVSSDDGRNTYEIRKELLDAEGKPIKGDKALLIGMYPTVTAEDGYKLDMTTLHILSKMEELGLCSVRIVNLFSKVCNARLSARGLEVDKANFEYMESVMKEKDFPSHKVIIAWGNSMTTSKACNHSKALFAQLFHQHNEEGHLYQLTAPKLDLENQETPHVLYLGIRHKTEPWGLLRYDFPRKPLPPQPPGPSKQKKEPDANADPKDKKTAETKNKPKLIYKA